MITSFRRKPLRQFWEEGSRRALRPDLVERILDRLTLLHVASTVEDIDVPGARFHRIHGGRYAISVNKNWRITFEWSEDDAIDVDLEEYH